MSGKIGVERILKEGYWERTSVVRKVDGTAAVRKEIKGDVDDRPWARLSLVREIRFLETLPECATKYFPNVLTRWGIDEASGPVGYEMPLYEGWSDVGSLVQKGILESGEGKRLEREVASVLVSKVHAGRVPEERLSHHVASVMGLVCDALAGRDGFESLVEDERIQIDGQSLTGLRRSIETIAARGLLDRLDDSPQVLLHGDLILENVLIPLDEGVGVKPRFVLIDPVSVAGVFVGHPAFDLAKYESYASGDLFAMRSGALVGKVRSPGSYSFNRREAGELRRFRSAGLGKGFREQWTERYGEPDPELLHLLDAYFSLAMAINTSGAQPLTRALVAAKSLGYLL